VNAEPDEEEPAASIIETLKWLLDSITDYRWRGNVDAYRKARTVILNDLDALRCAIDLGAELAPEYAELLRPRERGWKLVRVKSRPARQPAPKKPRAYIGGPRRK
jgi:hypothetical protein